MNFYESSFKRQKVEQLSETPVSDDVDIWQTKVDALEIELLSNESMTQLPGWWYEKTVPDDIEQKLEDPADIRRYIDINTKYQTLDDKMFINDTFHDYPPKSEVEIFASATYGLSPEQIAQAAIADTENGILRQTLLTILENKPDEKVLEILQHTFKLDNIAQLFAIKGGPYADLVYKQLRNPKVIYEMMGAVTPYDEKTFNMKKSRETLVEQILVNSFGLSEIEVRDYAFSAIQSYSDEQIVDLIERFDHFGIDRLRAITKETGIIGVESYSIELLERMERLVTKPEQVAEELREHDVSVVLINRYSSDNSVMRNVAPSFDDADGSGRMLFFEIADPADIYRSFVKLNKAGIKPATVTIVAHGSAGGFVIADGRNPESSKDRWLVTDGKKFAEKRNTANSETGRNQISAAMHDMSGLARVVEDYMQPSRGIDDASEDEGRKKIVLVTCQMAAEAPQFDIDNDGNKVQIGNESVVGRLGKDLAAAGISSSVDIYGAVESIQISRTDQGLQFTDSPKTMGGEREKIEAVRLRLQAGTLKQDTVPEILLRK